LLVVGFWCSALFCYFVVVVVFSTVIRSTVTHAESHAPHLTQIACGNNLISNICAPTKVASWLTGCPIEKSKASATWKYFILWLPQL